jgi:LCP family protein required for cell wall assembly
MRSEEEGEEQASMSYYKGPILKRYAQQWKARQHPPTHPLSSLPGLRKLIAPRQPGNKAAEQRAKMPAANAKADRSARQTGTLLARLKSHRNRRSRPRTGKDGNRSTGTENTPSHLKRLNKRRRYARRSCLVLSLLLLALFTLSGLLITGLYLTETTILAPLAQFFHPINGDTNGSINGRAWNLLLLGSDNDQKFVFPDILTQVMMVIRVNPLAGSVTMVSIPRDSWVSVPGQGMHKIDQAFFLGANAHHNFDDGVRLARATIEQDYGVAIDRYAWVGLDGFSSVINTLGGIDIDVTHPLLDDSYPDDTGKDTSKANPYAVKRLYMPPGPQHLTGEQALEYVRSRHADLVGDIGRTQRQQEILQTMKKKLDIANVFNHLSELFHDLTGKVYTDLSQNELISVASFARDLPAEAIQRLTLGPGKGSQNYGILTQTNDPSLDQSQDIVLPICDTIQPALNRIFDLGDAQSCQINGGG